jgi:methylmalonyl-CoA mutase C-terminal domain/subunit
LATDHLIVPKLMAALAEADLGHVGVVVGGIVPESEERLLIEAGVDHVFHPGAQRDEIVERIGEVVAESRIREGEDPHA